MNVWTISGRLTKQPQMKTVGDSELCSFSVAINETKDSTMFVDCDWWGSQGKFMTQLVKGTYVTVMGRLTQRKWTTKEGAEKTVIGCRVDRVTVGGKSDVAQPQTVQSDPKPRREAEVVVEEPEEDDIPF